ncbi:RNA-directed DNA polymerase, eukaryota, reverse transcriptase zinc-binding domain protein [Tanacetum coccineum]
MGTFRSKEDDVQQISTSVFVTNFPDQFSAKDLWNTCKQYGYVVDAFIPNRKSKAGKRFGFVRFIKIFDVDRLVNNLCTVWVGRHKIHANLARFQRPPLYKNNNQAKIGESRHNLGVPLKTKGPNGTSNSYAHVVKGSQSHNLDSENIPAMMLDDSCLNQQNFNCCLMGKVKNFESLSNLKVVLVNEGFDNIDLKYMGGYWVMIKFQSEEAKKTFQSNVGIGTWFAKIQQASTDFFVEGRVAWVDIEGVPLKMWSDNTFKRIASKWGTLIHADSHEDGNFYTKRICINTNITSNILESFKIIYRGKLFWVRAKEVPGWEPDFMEDNDDDSDNDDDLINDLKKDEELEGDSDTEAVPDTIFDDASIHINAENASVEKQKTHSEDPFNIYKLLTKNKENNHKEFNLEDSLKYPPGFTPINDNVNSEGQSNKFTGERLNNIQEEVLKDKFNEDAAESTCSGHFKKSNISRTGGSILQVMEEMVKETKMENIDLFSIKRCWGNLAFDYAHSASVGNSGGILCVWDPKSFSKLNATISDYFVMVRGDWIPNGTKLLIISIYAPQDLSEKKMLWDYLSHVIAQWAGEVVVMGDFNEVRKKDERFGSVFNVHGANAFNLFISNAGLEEVPLGGCSYTWCHKSASKMSKLDRFLISESLMNSCPNISAITLERFLSDHRPILMRESHYDYGPVPFRFFHYWFEIKGFDKFVEDSWKEAVVVEPNAMTKLMKKLKHLKEKIRLWNKGNTMSSINRKRTLKSDLADLDLIIDKGCGDVEIVNKRANVVRSLQELENLQSLPKNQRLNGQSRAMRILSTTTEFSIKKEPDQIIDLECDVSKDEIKRAVWDCGTDKSPGPDGFTFLKAATLRLLPNVVLETENLIYLIAPSSKQKRSSTQEHPHASSTKKCCLRSSRGSVIVNGSPTEEFQFHKGLKQGIMLSPSLQLSHLFYADDVIFMGQWNESNLDTIVQVLECFHRASGLRLNVSKSSKVSSHMSRIQSWNETIEAMASRLSKWKMKTLSIGGRLTLLKSVLGSMPIYHMSIFKVPMKILQRMESIRSHFFNGSDPLAKKPTWVKWTNVLASKEKGGLGISSLYALNRALMFKWVWRFLSQNSSLWANVIKSIHGDHGKIGKQVKVSYPSIWLDIVKEVDLLKKRGLNLLSFVNKKVGNGSDTLFWEETWHGDVAFKFLFPRAYALESCKNIDVASKLSQNSLAFTFRREPRGGVEQDQFDSLKAMVEDDQQLKWEAKLCVGHNKYSSEAGCRRTRKSSAATAVKTLAWVAKSLVLLLSSAANRELEIIEHVAFSTGGKDGGKQMVVNFVQASMLGHTPNLRKDQKVNMTRLLPTYDTEQGQTVPCNKTSHRGCRVLGKLKDFLGIMAESNKKLQERCNDYKHTLQSNCDQSEIEFLNLWENLFAALKVIMYIKYVVNEQNIKLLEVQKEKFPKRLWYMIMKSRDDDDDDIIGRQLRFKFFKYSGIPVKFLTASEAHGIHSPASGNEENMNDVGTKVGPTPASNIPGAAMTELDLDGHNNTIGLNYFTMYVVISDRNEDPEHTNKS